MKKIIKTYLFTFWLPIIVSCNQRAEPETYLIPSNLIGEVNILFNKTEGAAKVYEDNRRVYKIPYDGILVTQFKGTDGFEDRQYYSIDENGRRMPLDIFRYEYSKDGATKWVVSDKNKKGIFLDGISGQYGNTDDAKAAQFEAFFVSSYNSLDSFFTNQYKKAFDDKIEKVTGLRLN